MRSHRLPPFQYPSEAPLTQRHLFSWLTWRAAAASLATAEAAAFLADLAASSLFSMPFTLSIMFLSMFTNWMTKARSASEANTHNVALFLIAQAGKSRRGVEKTQKQTLLKACFSSIFLPLVSWPSAIPARRARLHAATSKPLRPCICIPRLGVLTPRHPHSA